MRPENQYFGTQAKERIIGALLSLMEKYPFREITILQIAQESKLARRTFYLYYGSKLDVLNDYYDVLAREYYESIPEDVMNDHRARALLFFTFWKSHSSYLKLLQANHMLWILMSQFDKYLMKMMEPNLPGEERYYAAFYAGGLWATMYTWIEHDFLETPEELARITSDFDYQKKFMNNFWSD